jgi:hypothetical protein
MLGRDAAAGKTTRIFTREHADELHESAAKEEASLRAANADARVDRALRRLTRLATTTTTALEQLGDAPEAEQRRLGAQLQRTADRIERLAGGL